MNHLEELLYQYYDWKGYLVKRNIKVGKLVHGGWEMELDIIGYNPSTNEIIHVECSTDSHKWETRQKRFKKKFDIGREYILENVFPWLEKNTKINQLAILPSRSKDRTELSGGELITIDELVFKIIQEIRNQGKISKNAIPEQYHLLRMIQLVENGYYKKMSII